jgi:hypothetical protein
LDGITEGKGLLRKPRHGWDDNIRIDPGEIGWKMWTGLFDGE